MTAGRRQDEKALTPMSRARATRSEIADVRNDRDRFRIDVRNQLYASVVTLKVQVKTIFGNNRQPASSLNVLLKQKSNL